MTRRPTRSLLALAALVAAVGVGSTTSGATYTSAGVNPGNTLRAAQDWVGPAITVTNPGTPLRGTVTLAATATDTTSGVASVRIQRAAEGSSTWTDICTDTTAPYTCAWVTTDAADGRHDLRAVATDLAGNVTTSAVVGARLVDNTAPVATFDEPATAVRGTVTLTTSSTDAGSGIASVRYERAPADTATWTTMCTATTSPFSCPFTTTAVPTGDYDVRITVTDVAGNVSTDIGTVEVDNVAPAATMTDPGATISGVITLRATATDADAGVATVTIQRAPNGTTSWTTVCTTETSPYGCRFDTTTVADGLYAFRAIATDAAGNTTTSATVSSRRVDNSVSSVSLDDPGAYLRGAVTLTANASSTSGVTSVRIQRARSGSTTWTDICTDATSPFSCAFDTATTATPDGTYVFRAILTTGSGAVVTSASVTSQIDNSDVRGVDVDGTNRAGGIAGRVETGDTLTLTFSQLMRPASLVAGWNGTGAATVHVRLRDGAAITGGVSTADVLQLTADANGQTATGLGTVALNANAIRTGRTVSWAASATLSTVIVEGREATRVTMVLGTQTGGSGHLRTASAASAMVWSPVSAAQSLAGAATSTAPVTESGALDANF